MAFAQHINKENPNIIARKEKKAEKDEETKEITYFPQSSKDEKVVVYDEGRSYSRHGADRSNTGNVEKNRRHGRIFWRKILKNKRFSTFCFFVYNLSLRNFNTENSAYFCVNSALIREISVRST